VRVVLRLSGEANVDGGALKTVTLGDREFFIGRDPSCDWPVSDTLGMMSRRHCSLKKEGESVLLTDLSSNGTSLGSPGNRLVQGQPTPLSDTNVMYLGGEHVRIDYECHREEAPAQTDDFWGVNEIKRSREQAQPRRLPADADLNLFGDDETDKHDAMSLTLDAEPDRNVIDNVLSLDDDPTPQVRAVSPAPAPDHVTFETPAAAASAPEDLFALDSEGAGSDEDDPFADWSEQPTAKAEPLPDLAPPPENMAVSPVDRVPEQARPVPEQQSVADIAPPRHPTTVAPHAQPAAATASPAGNPSDETDRTLAALFASLGIAIEDIPLEERHEMAAEIGRSFRALADGMRELLASRRDVKIALGLGATQIETGSNPLKFCRDANDAVNALLRPSASGFLSGTTAVSDAVTALQQHQVALVGGVKASMKTALAAFDPNEIEGKLTKRGFSQIVPMKRKAELWEQFVENYRDFAAEADEDIRRVIGKQLEQLYADEATRSRAALNL